MKGSRSPWSPTAPAAPSITCCCGARVTPRHTPIWGPAAAVQDQLFGRLRHALQDGRLEEDRQRTTSAFPTRAAARRFTWRCGAARCPTDRSGRCSRGWAQSCPTTAGCRRTATPTTSCGRRTGTAALPKFWLKADWIYGDRYDHLYGQLTYKGTPVYGGSSTGRGSPTDSYGRLVTIDTLEPPWKGGLQAGRRLVPVQQLPRTPPRAATSATASTSTSPESRIAACPGDGKRYRATVNGPGVTPVLYWEGPPPGHYQPDSTRRICCRRQLGRTSLQPAARRRAESGADSDRPEHRVLLPHARRIR